MVVIKLQWEMLFKISMEPLKLFKKNAQVPDFCLLSTFNNLLLITWLIDLSHLLSIGIELFCASNNSEKYHENRIE